MTEKEIEYLEALWRAGTSVRWRLHHMEKLIRDTGDEHTNTALDCAVEECRDISVIVCTLLNRMPDEDDAKAAYKRFRKQLAGQTE